MAEHSSHDPLAGLPFDHVPPAGFYGAPGAPGVTVTTGKTPSLALAVARKGFAGSVTARLARAFGVALADRAGAAMSAASTVIGTGPGRFLVLSTSEPDLAGTLRALLGGEAAVTEQDDASVLFELRGEKVPDLLAKGALIDLDPRLFLPGAAATTVLGHIGVTLWRAEADIWRVLVARSFEASFTRFLVTSGAEFGLALENGAAGRG